MPARDRRCISGRPTPRAPARHATSRMPGRCSRGSPASPATGTRSRITRRQHVIPATASSSGRAPMNLRGLHLLLTYQCNLECDHCFVWGSPWQDGTMTIQDIRRILHQARDVGTIDWIYFEGGEPFLYYPILLHGVRIAAHMKFRVGVVSNGFNDPNETLPPLGSPTHVATPRCLPGSLDPYHGSE